MITSPSRLRVVVAEDNLLVRKGLLQLLGTCDSVEVVAAVESMDDLIAAVDETGPDVVLSDIQMGPEGTDAGIRAAQRLRETHPGLGVVVLSAYVEPAYAVDLLDGGTRGRGYLVKDHVADFDYLIGALQTVASGGSFIDDSVVDALVRGRSQADDQRMNALTTREREVLSEIATGRSNAAIAAALCVSEHAVEKHTNTILSKLGLTRDPDINRRVMAVLVYLASDRQGGPACCGCE